MSEIITVGLDLAKNIFQVHGADGSGQPVLRKKLRRVRVLEFSTICRPALWQWKPVAGRISGAARSTSLATMYG